MTELQAAEIIEQVFKAHWSTWKFPIEETRFWIARKTIDLLVEYLETVLNPEVF